MSRTLCVRIDDAVSSSLEKMRKNTERPISFIVKKALKNYFSEYADYQIALDRLRDKDDKVISSSELREKLGL